MLADHRSETKAEILAYRNELSESRFKIQQLEQTLNETMEVHQNEVKQLKSDLNLIGTRMDYQYNDRNRAVILIILCIVVAVVWDLFDISNRINRFFLYFAYKNEEKSPSK
uniref:Uncharacterized protein n=1 Tax=Acrobeloides nanus TaxID=290746 RepID=A0A914EM77_9BILA